MRLEFSIGVIANCPSSMAENDPDKLKGPGGLTLRQIHAQVQESVARDREGQTIKNELAQKPNRLQRAFSSWLSYVRDRKRG